MISELPSSQSEQSLTTRLLESKLIKRATTSIAGIALVAELFNPRTVVAQGLTPDEYGAAIVGETNKFRESAGAPPLVYFPEARVPLEKYLGRMSAEWQQRPDMGCFPGGNYEGFSIPTSFDYLNEGGISAEPRGEVMACPPTLGMVAKPWLRPEAVLESWTTIKEDEDPTVKALKPQIVGTLTDAQANAMACASESGKEIGAGAVTCVTFRIPLPQSPR